MTTEDDFRRALDANPEDWQTLAVFSDWLRDRGDPRADGYAALARRRKRPGVERLTNQMRDGWTGDWFAWARAGSASRSGTQSFSVLAHSPKTLPPDWYDAVKDANQLPNWDARSWACFRTPTGAFDAAAIGFTTLPPERRAELLAGRAKKPVRKRKRRNRPGGKAS
jgi:uncharacterized protein (TIGR02996 family)